MVEFSPSRRRKEGWGMPGAVPGERDDAIQGRSAMSGPQLKRRLACSEQTHDRSFAAEPVDWDAAEGRSAADAERELAEAIREYQRTSRRMFPTWSEVLEIVHELGYRKPD